jgi:hypothetical protein
MIRAPDPDVYLRVTRRPPRGAQERRDFPSWRPMGSHMTTISMNWGHAATPLALATHPFRAQRAFDRSGNDGRIIVGFRDTRNKNGLCWS